jgi:hypothetical protein
MEGTEESAGCSEGRHVGVNLKVAEGARFVNVQHLSQPSHVTCLLTQKLWGMLVVRWGSGLASKQADSGSRVVHNLKKAGGER